jgi:hypothetical protein
MVNDKMKTTRNNFTTNCAGMDLLMCFNNEDLYILSGDFFFFFLQKKRERDLKEIQNGGFRLF